MAFRGLLYYSPSAYLRRGLWALAQPLWRWSPRPLWGWRNGLLQLFGGRVEPGVRVYPSARLHQPWHLSIGRGTTVAWNVTLYALGPLQIGRDCVISQGAHLCAGTHDPRDPGFPLIKAPIAIGDGVWIAADAFIGPRVRVGDGAVVGARAVVVRDVPAAMVVAGNPARVVARRWPAGPDATWESSVGSVMGSSPGGSTSTPMAPPRRPASSHDEPCEIKIT